MAEPESVPQEPLLNTGQRRLLGVAVTLFALAASVAIGVLIIIVLGKLIGYFSGVLWPLVVAAVIALILRPIVDILESRFRGRRLAAVIVLFSAFTIAVSALLIAIGPPLAGQILDFIAYLPDLRANVTRYIESHYPAWIDIFERLQANPTFNGLITSAQDQLGKLPSLVLPSLKALSDGVIAAFSLTAQLAVIPIYLFFFLLSRADPTFKMGEHLSFIPQTARVDIVFLVREFIAIVVSFFRGQLLIGLIMGALLAIGFSLVGLKFGLVIGLVLGVLNIVPYLGTIIGLFITVPLAFVQPNGGVALVGFVLAVYVVVQNIEGFFLTPKIMGDRTGLHPVTIIFAVFFWGVAFDGILGMVLAIPLTAFFVTFWRLMKRKHFAPPAEKAAPVAAAPVSSSPII
jgi:predicted PurR-regulated permease PerM